jgi:hypothetical protein
MTCDMKKETDSGNQVSAPLTGQLMVGQLGAVKAWLSARFAEPWYSDAKREAIDAGDTHRRRREITFAVAAAESYLLEWTRDEVLSCDFERLNSYFPPGNWSPISDRWKEVTKALARDGLIKAAPNFGGQTWQEFRRLIEFRNGLIHARASRPENSALTPKEMPSPTMAELQALDPGWAVNVVGQLIRELNTAAGTKPPSWL